MLRIGLTGGIGSGKSVVAELFAAKEVPVLDADVVSKALVRPGCSALKDIVVHFGGSILTDNGDLDRGKLRNIIFNEPDQKRWLQSLLHPLVYSAMEAAIKGISTKLGYCLLVVPLLLESGRRNFVDRLIVVDCPEELQKLRIAARNGYSQAEIDLILSGQASRMERLGVADYIIENVGSKEDLRLSVDHLHDLFMTIARDNGLPC